MFQRAPVSYLHPACNSHSRHQPSLSHQNFHHLKKKINHMYISYTYIQRWSFVLDLDMFYIFNSRRTEVKLPQGSCHSKCLFCIRVTTLDRAIALTQAFGFGLVLFGRVATLQARPQPIIIHNVVQVLQGQEITNHG